MFQSVLLYFQKYLFNLYIENEQFLIHELILIIISSMAENLLNDVERWKWNWTELCGSSKNINPLNPETHDLDVCFQQLCLQVIR